MSDLVERVRAVLPSVRDDLENLVRIPSVWADPARRDHVHRSAQATADLVPYSLLAAACLITLGLISQGLIRRRPGAQRVQQ